MDLDSVFATVDFDYALRPWDGFGATYVQTAQTRDYATWPQDYGSFSIMPEDQRHRVLDLTFGNEGLRVGIVKMFLDPFHAAAPGTYDHDRTTASMLAFVKGGLARTRARGEDLQAMVTLYGPPAWATKQRVVRGRDLDPARLDDVAAYLAHWAQHLRKVHGIPVTAVSLHNEGEDWARWEEDGAHSWEGHDHNVHMPPAIVVDLVKRTRRALDGHGLRDVRVTPGETSNWYRFDRWGYAQALADDPEALAALGLITSHGFLGGKPGVERWYGDARSAGTDLLRSQKPDLHAWVTSQSWWKQEPAFLDAFIQSIYGAQVNAVIPWAIIQRHSQWTGGDPNPGTAFLIDDTGRLHVQKAYWLYKQLCRVGRAGTQVARCSAPYRQLAVAAFAGDSRTGNGFVLVNSEPGERKIHVKLAGTRSGRFAVCRCTPAQDEEALAEVAAVDGRLRVTLPGESATSFVEV